MSTTIAIPLTQSSIQLGLKALWLDQNTLEWRRAALVHGWIDLALDNPRLNSQAAAFNALATLKIQGIGTKVTKIRSYYQVWENAIELGLTTAAVPGQSVDLPSMSFDELWATTPHAALLRKKSKPRVATFSERADTALRTVRASIKQETDPDRRAKWQVAETALSEVADAYAEESE